MCIELDLGKMELGPMGAGVATATEVVHVIHYVKCAWGMKSLVECWKKGPERKSQIFVAVNKEGRTLSSRLQREEAQKVQAPSL